MLQAIATNYYNYYKSFVQSGIIKLHEGAVSWIIPCKGEKGPSIAFRIRLNEENAETELKTLIQGIRKGEVPRLWIVTPDVSPDNIINLMEKKGFKNLSDNSSEPEPAMALHKQEFIPYREDSSRITCQKISTKEDFISWIDVVNTALHGWNMIDAEHYFSWVKSDNIKIYSAKINGITVSTCATIQNGNTASLEFVSTLEQYRRRKASALLCSCAINDLLKNGVEIVTLSACGESVYLYEGLGFKKYFNNIIMKYDC